METSSPYRPRVSRETRLLLIAGIMAVVALWLLARIRFPERSVTANPVPSMLSQLARGSSYQDLAEEIAQLNTRLQPLLLMLDSFSSAAERPQPATRSIAIRLRDDLAVAFIPSGATLQPRSGALLARDAPSGLGIIRVPAQGPIGALVPWTPRQPQQPRYLAATDVTPGGVSLRPVFVGALAPIDSPLWPTRVWAVPDHTDLSPGSFVFTTTGELVGLAITHGGTRVVVPGETILAEAERLVAAPPGPPGTIGVEVQNMTPALMAVTGASSGVIVSWVDPKGPAEQQLRVGDVVEAIDGQALATERQWDVRMSRLAGDERLSLRVRRGTEVSDVTLSAGAGAARPSIRSLGLTMEARAGTGARVLRISEGSAADLAGLAPGDVITQIAAISAPTPSQVTRSYNSMTPGERVLVAITRGQTHFVTTFER